MKNRLKAWSFLLFIIIQGCSNKDCEDLLCFTPPRSFVFNVVDKETGENLFTNGTYTPEQIQVTNVEDGTRRAYSFIDEDALNYIVIASIGWETEIANVLLTIDGDEILTLYVDAERKSENCCSFTSYNEIRIENAEYEQDQQSEVYTIFRE